MPAIKYCFENYKSCDAYKVLSTLASDIRESITRIK